MEESPRRKKERLVRFIRDLPHGISKKDAQALALEQGMFDLDPRIERQWEDALKTLTERLDKEGDLGECRLPLTRTDVIDGKEVPIAYLGRFASFSPEEDEQFFGRRIQGIVDDIRRLDRFLAACLPQRRHAIQLKFPWWPQGPPEAQAGVA
jgi:hypothetical protein